MNMSVDAALQKRIYARYNANGAAGSLSRLASEFLNAQMDSWPGLVKGYEALALAEIRHLRCDGFRVSLQYNPGRIVSTAADIDPAEIMRRRCFLCAEHLPPQQLGIEYRHRYLILCNPFPIFDGHLTISHMQHIPQAIEGELKMFLDLVKDFSPGFTVFYNGARCGASAPDHMHFQAAPKDTMPIEKGGQFRKKRTSFRTSGEVSFYRLREMGRAVFVLEGRREPAVELGIRRFIDALKATLACTDEPMLNLLGSYGESGWRIVLFPRRKHRPAAYYREGEARVTVSPGLVDMGGLIITPLAGDFKKMNARAVMEIYEEVSLEEDVLEELISSL